MQERDLSGDSTPTPGPAAKPASRASNKATFGCLLTGILLVGGCVAYVATNGQSSNSSSSSSSSAGNPPAVAEASSAAASPAQRLADLDGDTQPVSAYQAALDALAPKCTQDEANIAGLGDAGYNDLVKNGVTDETRLTVLQHLDASMPSSLGKTDCAQILSAYLVLREQG